MLRKFRNIYFAIKSENEITKNRTYMKSGPVHLVIFHYPRR